MDLLFKIFVILTCVSIFQFIISPFPNLYSFKSLIVFFENLIIYYVIYFELIKKIKNIREKKISQIWIITLIFSFIFLSVFMFNDGSIHRYKTTILFFILIGFNISKYQRNLTKK